MANTGFLHQVITDEGFVAANTLAKVLHITQKDLADATGLSRDSVSKSSRCKNRPRRMLGGSTATGRCKSESHSGSARRPREKLFSRRSYPALPWPLNFSASLPGIPGIP